MKKGYTFNDYKKELNAGVDQFDPGLDDLGICIYMLNDHARVLQDYKERIEKLEKLVNHLTTQKDSP